jgi:NADPH-dependent 2,4-dienoyl-CoA reductase/sulfur reductase-like enzyme
MTMDRILIAGASIAGVSAARALRTGGFEGKIQMVDLDARTPYRRPEVSKGLLDGHHTDESVAMPIPETLEVEQLLGLRLHDLNLEQRTVEVLRDHEAEILPFDGLVIATGAMARPSPFDPSLRGVHTLRNIHQATLMRGDLAAAERVVIIGGGFIGLEVAAVARTLGKSVTVVEATDVPLGHVLGVRFGNHLADMHRVRGVNLVTGASVTGLESRPDGAVDSVALSDGRQLPADVVLVAIGSAPSTEWLAASGLDVTSGVVCDTTCAVEGTEDVVAAGDVASWINPLYGRRMRVEHWTNAIEQGTYAGRRLLGSHDPGGFRSAPYFWSDQYGMRLQSLGSTQGFDEASLLDHDGDKMVVAYGLEGKTICVAGINAGTQVMRYRKAVLERAELGALPAPGSTAPVAT